MPTDVLFITQNLDRGGAQRQLVTLARGLARRGHSITVAVFYSRGTSWPELEWDGVRVVALEKGGRWDVAAFLARVGTLVRNERPRVIHAPNSFALARTVEYFRIPRQVLTICLGKSTYARCGIIVNVTPFEPEWEGYVTLEFSNTTPLPAKIYAGEGCAQVLFFESDEVCETSYKDRGGKYQGQVGVTLPKA